MALVAHMAELLATLTPKQAVAVEHLTGGATHRAAAAAAGVSRETVTRWVSDIPSVRAALDSARYASSIETIDRVAAIRSRALDVVEQHLDTLDPSEPVALAVAVSLLKVLPVPAVPVERPELAETLAYEWITARTFHARMMTEAGPIEESTNPEIQRRLLEARRPPSAPVVLDPPRARPAPVVLDRTAHTLTVVTGTGDPAA